MPILPLPQFEADLAEADREAYERLKPPTSIVVRFGVMKLVGEFPYSGESKPGCGSRLVVRTHRGTEIGEMLTSTCPNAGCSKSVTRKQMLEYIENSGGADYPFFSDGRVLRVATAEDMAQQSRLEESAPGLVRRARQAARDLALPMKIIDAEPILGGEKITYYFTAEDRVDFRELVRALAADQHTRIEMRQVGARDEARLVADYERCGQHCCCKQFLKVLKPVSMRSAKVQKATLDPLKISGRCGRLMCCLRYEDETYESLKKRLPRMKSRVGTPEGPGIVVDAQILTQLVLVQLERENRRVAVPVEELSEPPAPGVGPTPTAGGSASTGPGGAGTQAGRRPDQPAQPQQRVSDPLRGMDPDRVARRVDGSAPGSAPARAPGYANAPSPDGSSGGGDARKRSVEQQQERYRDRARGEQRDQGQRGPRPPSAPRNVTPNPGSAAHPGSPTTPAAGSPGPGAGHGGGGGAPGTPGSPGPGSPGPRGGGGKRRGRRRGRDDRGGRDGRGRDDRNDRGPAPGAPRG